MPTRRDVALLRESAAALRSQGDLQAAAEVDRAVDRLERPVLGGAADLDGVRRGVFRLRDDEDDPKPRPPVRRYPSTR